MEGIEPLFVGQPERGPEGRATGVDEHAVERAEAVDRERGDLVYGRRLRDVTHTLLGPLAELSCHLLDGVLTACDQKNPGALRDQLLRYRPAEPAARAAYHKRLVLQA